MNFHHIIDYLMIRFLFLLSFLSSIHAFSQESNQLSRREKVSTRGGDTKAPELLSGTALTDTTLCLLFNEAVDIDKAQFSINGDNILIKRAKLLSDGKSVLLTATFRFQNEKAYTVEVNQVKDIAGNTMPVGGDGLIFSYHSVSLKTVGPGDIVFNEIMANPKGGLLPEVEYIELYNRLDTVLSLDSCKLCSKEEEYTILNVSIPAKGYLVLCGSDYKQQWAGSNIPLHAMPCFYTLPNTGGMFWLNSPGRRLISWINYSDSWYKDIQKKKGGFSLECIDPDNLTNSSDNWQASEDESGGTPGRENSVKSAHPDELMPEVLGVDPISADTLMVRFNKPMLLSSLSDLKNYQLITPKIELLATIPELPFGQNVKLLLEESLQAGEVAELEVSGVKDISGIELRETQRLTTVLPLVTVKGDLLFNEILFNPHPGGVDYVELYNLSGKYLSLNNLYLATKNEQGILTKTVSLSIISQTFPPNSYLCFTSDANTISNQFETKTSSIVELAGLPDFPDEKGSIQLLTSEGEILDQLNYSEGMHAPLQTDKEGVSLEKRSPEMDSTDPANWSSASALAGYGTPGYVNSLFQNSSSESSEDFRLESKSFSPDGDGLSDELQILYSLSDDGFVANAKVYDVSGNLVKVLINNLSLGAQGTFTWNGKRANGAAAGIGIYLIFIEMHNAPGMVKRYKLPCVLTI